MEWSLSVSYTHLYMGANRIASITAYGENAQGGTTEAPVALTGISSITVNDDVTELPIPRPLHKVGDVRDVCRTRVKSVYDKRIVLDGAEDWKMGGAVGDGAPYIFCDLLNDHYQAFPIISSRFPSTNILADVYKRQLIESLENSFNGILSVIKPVNEAFREVRCV